MKTSKFTLENLMKEKMVKCSIIFGCCIAVLMTAFVAGTAAQEIPFYPFPSRNPSGEVKTEIAPVQVFGSPTIIHQAGASLSRNNSGVFATISTSGLTPGNVVTLWWAFFNSPGYCAAAICTPADLNNPSVNGSLQYGGGYLVGVNGRADFSGYLGARDNTGFFFLPPFPNMPNPAPGLVDPKGAQIHLVIRDHGPASTDPEILQQQLSTFGSGANIQDAIFKR